VKTVTEPSTVAEVPAGSEAEVDTPSEAKANILVVDDREDKRLAMRTVIAELGQNIVSAASGGEALRQLLNQDFAVILLDINMPGMDGFETAHLIRQRVRSEHTPIIFVTGVSDADTHISRGYSLGAVDYILTPVMPEVLRTKVSVFVELFKKSDQLKRQAERLRRARADLEARVRERTLELAAANESLQAEIAERQRAEARILRINGELEERVSERTAELGAANLEMEAFTYSVAHDIQAPLRNILSYAQLIQEEFGNAIPDEAADYIRRISSRGHYMRQLVEDLLNLSLVGKQNLDLQATDLSSICNEIVNGLQLDLVDRKIDWRLSPLAVVSGDAGLIKQLFANLLSNAVKYTKPREKAVIEVGHETVDGQSQFYVRDNGVGFDMRHAGKLFGAFQRLHRPDKFPGTGVGLAIAARIVRRHGGRIWAASEENKGAQFSFTLGPSPSSRTEEISLPSPANPKP
jgi:signal transduction histidine kinase